jgi:exodeoxyribonuclease VII small subunit
MAAVRRPDAEAGGELDFEAALAELEQLVDQMEGGELSLEASLAAFERGVKLTRQCQAALRAAELKVQQLTRNDTLEDLDLEELDDA